MNSNNNPLTLDDLMPEKEEDIWALEEGKATECEPESFKHFLINEYSETILDEIVTLETLKEYKLAIYFYLYSINSYLFTGIDDDFGSDSYGEIELPYSFFHKLILKDILEIKNILAIKVATAVEINPQEIALQRLVTIYQTDNFNGFSEEGKWDYLFQLKNAILYFIYCNKHYEDEINYNPLQIGINEEEIQTGCIGVIILHSELKPKKIDSIHNIGLSKVKFGLTAKGRHISEAPAGLTNITFSDINSTEDTLGHLFGDYSGKPISKSSKVLVRNNRKKNYDTKTVKERDIADDLEFPLNDTEITDSIKREYGEAREKSEIYKKHRDNYINSFNEYNDSYIGAKDYCSDFPSENEGWTFIEGQGWTFIENKGWKPRVDRWGTYSFPCYNERLLLYLNKYFLQGQQITTEDQYKDLVLYSISEIDSGSSLKHLFKLEQKYNDPSRNFMLEIFKHFLRKNTLGLSDEDLVELKKLFFCYFYYREAGDIKNKVLPDHIYHARVIHTLFSCVFGSNYDMIDFSCNHVLGTTDISQSQIDEFKLKYTLASAANSRANSTANSQSYSQSYLTANPQLSVEEELQKQLLELAKKKGGTRKKGNKNNRKTRKLKKVKKSKKRNKKNKKNKKSKKMKKLK